MPPAVNTAARNLITDVGGLRVGNAASEPLVSGVTVVLCDPPAVGAVDVRGGGPGTRETDLLDPANTVGHIDAIALAGGSAFGLAAASGVQTYLREAGRGYAVGPVRVPIVPSAIIFDLLNGGDKNWAGHGPYADLGQAAANAAGADFALGSTGAGTGATTFNLKGGLGSASQVTGAGHTVGALVIVNAVGSATIGDGPHFWASPYEIGEEFGGLGWPREIPAKARIFRHKAGMLQNTTLAVVATDAALTPAQCKRVAIAAHDGFARALYPVHTPFDGDIVFALSTALRPATAGVHDVAEIGSAAADAVARAIARGIYEATRPAAGTTPATWQELFAASNS